MERVKIEVNEEIRKNCTEVRKEMRDVVEKGVVRIRRDIQEDVDRKIKKFEEKLEEVMKELETEERFVRKRSREFGGQKKNLA